MMKFSLCIFLIFNVWHLCPAVQLITNRGYFIVVQELKCVTNPNYITKSSCDVMTPRNRSINGELKLMQNLNALMATIKISIPNPKKKVFQKIFDITFETCKVFRERKRKALIDLLASMMHLGNNTLQCPITEGFYQVKNVTIVESLPPVLTESPFILQLTWFLPRVLPPLMNISVQGHLFYNGSKKKKIFKIQQ